VVIAALNEEASIGAAVDSARAAGAGEIIVADGSSRDRTAEIAAARGAKVIVCEAMRARQFNRGAALATGDALIFLHADTTLPAGAAAAVVEALQRADFGGFLLRFAERALALRVSEILINVRTRITRCPWGDQAQFIRRTAFPGFREIPIMEDYDLARRMRDRSVILGLRVITSGRRFLKKGALRTAITNWRIVAAWHRGVDPETLAKWYRRF
jgi:rSAM/selenodomain-associated transferase 2